MSDPRRTQGERRSEAERRLLGAAAELIGEVGPSRVTLAGIGERAGYSRGLATHHFGSKGTMMQRLVDTVTVEFREAIFQASQSDSVVDEAKGLIRAYFAALSGTHTVNRARLVLWADAVAAGSPDVRPSMVAADRQFRDELAKRIERGVSSGQVPADVDPVGLAGAIVGMLRGTALQYLLDDQLDLARSQAEVEALVLGRLQASR